MLFMTSLPFLPLAQLAEDHDEEIKRVLTRRLGCVEAAADILQETYRRLADSGLWERAENPRALAYRIALNLATDHERRLTSRGKYLVDDATVEEIACPAPQPDEVLQARERLERLSRAIDTLPPKCRQVFTLRKFDDLSQQAIAERLGISRNMVEKHLRHALTLLRAQVD